MRLSGPRTPPDILCWWTAALSCRSVRKTTIIHNTIIALFQNTNFIEQCLHLGECTGHRAAISLSPYIHFSYKVVLNKMKQRVLKEFYANRHILTFTFFKVLFITMTAFVYICIHPCVCCYLLAFKKATKNAEYLRI